MTGLKAYIRSIVILCILVQGLGQSDDPGTLSANHPPGARTAKSARTRTRRDTQTSRFDNINGFSMGSKEVLAYILHYQGLEDPPDPGDVEEVPTYVRIAFRALEQESNSEQWTQNERDLHAKESDKTIWGIKVHQVAHTRHHTQVQFKIQKEVLLVNRSRVELVFPHPLPHLGNLRMHSLRYRGMSQISLCSTNTTVFSTCTSERRMVPDTIHVSSKFYHVYDITSLFERWLDATGTQNCPFPLIVTVPRAENFVDWAYARSTDFGPLVVIYSNLPNFVLSDYIVPNFHLPVQNTPQRQGRFRRSLPGTYFQPRPPYESLSRHFESGFAETSTIPTLNHIQEPAFCSLVDWYIDFRVIGWDSFIQEPSGYHGNLCLGSCGIHTLSNDVNISNHAFIKNLYQLEMMVRTDLGLNIPRVYCIPLSIRPISILFSSGPDTFVKRTLHDMSISSCGCL